MSTPLRTPPAASSRWSRTLPSLIAGYGLGYVVWLLVADAGPARGIVANVGYLPVMMLATALAWRISRHRLLHRRVRLAWQLVVAWCVLNLSGDTLWAFVQSVQGQDPSSRLLIHAIYLLSYPVLVAALILFPQTLRSRRDGLAFLLDAAMVVVGGGMLVWHLVVVPTALGTSGTGLQRMLALAYPIGDLIVLFGVATLLLRCPPGRRRVPMVLLACSFAAMLVADVFWAHLNLRGYTGGGGWEDIGYMTQYVLLMMSLCAEHQRLAGTPYEEGPLSSRGFTALPYLAVAGGYVLLLLVAWAGPARLFELVAGSVILTILVTVRQLLLVRDNVRLLRERARRASEARFRSLIQHASDIVTIVRADATIAFVSPAVTRVLGHQAEGLEGTSFLDLVHPDDVADARLRLGESLSRPHHAMRARWRLRHREHGWVPCDSVCTNLLSDEYVGGLVLTTQDVSERCALEAQLAHQAFHDPLTGLANRALFQDRVRHALTRRSAEVDGVAVLFIDLDRFKIINDSLGHGFGDALLKLAAERLSGSLRSFDTAARLGGDEFAVLIEDTPRIEDVTYIADRVARVFRDPFTLGEREVYVTASVGVARASVEQHAEELLRNADLAMYLAKSRGRAQSAVYEPAMHAAVMNRLELVEDLRHAIDRGEMHVAYQPIHALDTHALVGVEALLRWTHATRGAIPPSVFIPLAEETGLIVPIGRWVLSHACRDARYLQTSVSSLGAMTVAVNLSGRQIPEPSLLPDVQKALDDAGLAPEHLVLELTESVLLEHTDQAQAVMDCLKMLGVSLAIDDFGTGYSSLSYLQRLPLDILKIDRSFIERLGMATGADALARAVIGIGATLSLRTVAEGVEREEQAEFLRKLGCHRGQGFLYGAAMPVDDLASYARRAAAASAA